MVGRTLLMLTLLATLSLSGCLDDGPDEAAEPLDAAPSAEPTPAPGARKAAVAAGNLTPVEEPFIWDGSLNNMVFACAVITCNGAAVGTWDGARDIKGVVAGALSVTWDLPSELGFGLATRCDGPCDFVVTDYGTSPLTIAFDDLDPDRTYTLVAWHPYRGAGVAGAQAGPQVDFHVEGVVMAV